MSLLDKLFVSLRVLSKLPEGGRICTTGTGQIKIEDTNTLGGWIATGRRRLTGDSREEAVRVLMQIINEISEISDNLIDSIRSYGGSNAPPHINVNAKKCQKLEKICTMLKSSKKGVVNLHSTYVDDANIAAKLEEIMEKMDSQHERIVEILGYVRTISRTAPIAIPQNLAHQPPVHRTSAYSAENADHTSAYSAGNADHTSAYSAGNANHISPRSPFPTSTPPQPSTFVSVVPVVVDDDGSSDEGIGCFDSFGDVNAARTSKTNISSFPQPKS